MKREMKHSGVAWIGEIPKHWEVVRNKNAFSNSKTIVGESWNNTQLLSLTTKGIKAIDIGSTSGKVPDSYETYQVVGKDNLVMCLFDLDCSAVFSGLSQIEGMISPAYKVLTVQNGFLPAFYDKWFNYIFDGRKFMFLSKNIRYSLTYDEFASLQIVKPPIEEQQKIAKFLDRKCGEIDEMISLQEKVIEELKAYKQSVITEAVTKGLNPNVAMRDSEIEWIGEIPEHWEQGRLKNYFHLHGRIGWNGLRSEEFKESSYAYLVTGQDFVAKDIDWQRCYQIDKERYDEDEYIQLENGDILVTKDGTIGKVAIVSNLDKPACLNSGIFVVKQNTNNCYCSNYLYWLLVSHLLKTFNDFLNLGGTTIIHLYQNVFERMPLVLPPIEEQKEIADYLDRKCNEIDRLIEIKGRKIEELKEYKKSLIYEYVTGKKEI
jgi:type I restriction enzyme S subunit